MNTTRSTGLPENFSMITAREITFVFGVECECVRRGWFQIVDGVKHELRSANLVRLIANMPSLRRDAICRTSIAVSRMMFG